MNKEFYLWLTCCFFCGTTSTQPAAPMSSINCVATTSTSITRGGQAMVDVALTNNCKKDITAVAVGQLDQPGAGAPANVTTLDMVNFLAIGPLKNKSEFEANDILKMGTTMHTLLAAPREDSSRLRESALAAVVYADATAEGDPVYIEIVAAGRRDYLKGLQLSRTALAGQSEYEKAKAALHLQSASRDTKYNERQSSRAENILAMHLDNATRYIQISSEEEWRVYLEHKLRELDSAITIYTQQSTLRISRTTEKD